MLFDLGPDKRFYGVYRGVCLATDDPDNLGRLKLKVPQVSGDASTNWCPSCVDPSFKVEPGDGVWVMFEGGDPNFPVWLGTF